ncbi:MAG TPA: NADH-quinone oxidoreductase subunit L [Leptospiraceae bacterium]|nr:NADH-quinone oxidoreductase subunit L [Leptospiraceae bacterium]HNO22648.1 NADH-quinone oxidoreductase subunit L [Leptospiraceae bacterium]
MLDLFPLVVLLPLAGFLINGFFHRKIPHTAAAVIGISAVAVPFFITLGALFEFQPLVRKTPHLFSILSWIHAGKFAADFAYQVDQLSLYMTLIITGIGSLIHLYSVGYMHGESGFNRFFVYLNLFIFSMLNLVLGDNLVLMFLGWEGVGVCSYLLIGFDFHKSSAANAGMKAFIVNRIGDVGFAVGIFLTYWYLGSVKYVDIMTALPTALPFKEIINWVALAFFIGAIGKSAQIPLYVWLPDAMAGPTPVSALIHAATMVTAGVFMIARLNPIFYAAEHASTYIAFTGAVTALFAATIGLFQTDIKKVLAYSTVSQLGYMFLAMGVGAYTAGMFHLMTHAFFKALMFLGSGSVIHAMHHEQDMRNMGNLKNHMKITWITFMIGTLAIAGIPPFSGFFSKDLILEKAFSSHYGMVLWTLGIAGAFTTAFYMFRLVYLTFYGKERIDHHVKEHLHESPWTITTPLVILAVGAAFAGLLQIPHIIGGGVHLLDSFFAPIFAEGPKLGTAWGIVKAPHELSHSAEWGLLLFSVAVASAGIFTSYTIFIKKSAVPPKDEDFAGLPKVIYNKYYVDEIYQAGIVDPLMDMSDALAQDVDKKIIDGSVVGVGRFFMGISDFFRKIQTGIVGDYALMVVIGAVIFLFFLFAKGA